MYIRSSLRGGAGINLSKRSRKNNYWVTSGDQVRDVCEPVNLSWEANNNIDNNRRYNNNNNR